MQIAIDPSSTTPLYQQIEAYLRNAILNGALAPGTRLPATRHLARDLRINRITVETAYGELEADGLVYSLAGSGTYVQAQEPAPAIPQNTHGAPWPLWQQEIRAASEIPERLNPDEMLRSAGHPHPISFAGGVGDAHIFPVDDFSRVIRTIFRRDGITALEYGEACGYTPLRSTIAQVLTSQGVTTRPDNVLVTAGSQQALSIVTQVLLRPGDTVLVESPTYAGALDIFHASHLKIVGIPVDERGMQVDQLEPLLQRHHPRLIYTIPNFQNPTGVCLSTQRRHQLIALADRYNIPILEDDFVGDLRYEGHAQPALKSLDPGGRVIYISTFSKMLMPGLRVGFLVADGPVYNSLVDCKRLNDLTTSNFLQRALEAYVTVGRYQVHLRRSVHLYRKRRDALAQAIRRHLPEARFELPQGGLYIWLQFPEGISSKTLLPLACEEGVAFAPGSSFYPTGAEGDSYARLNFVIQTPEAIEEGVRRIAVAINKMN